MYIELTQCDLILAAKTLKCPDADGPLASQERVWPSISKVKSAWVASAPALGRGALITPNPKLRLLDQVREVMR